MNQFSWVRRLDDFHVSGAGGRDGFDEDFSEAGVGGVAAVSGDVAEKEEAGDGLLGFGSVAVFGGGGEGIEGGIGGGGEEADVGADAMHFEHRRVTPAVVGGGAGAAVDRR